MPVPRSMMKQQEQEQEQRAAWRQEMRWISLLVFHGKRESGLSVVSFPRLKG